MEIDSKKIETPKIQVTDNAARQIHLALTNDPYTKGKIFRVQVSGKGCDGFSYSTFFDNPRTDDFVVNMGKFSIHLTPFTAYYLSEFTLDYIFDPQTENEGFLVLGENQEDFAGKFWRKSPELTPPMKEI